MGRVGELVTEYACLLHPCHDTSDVVAFAEKHRSTVGRFRAAVREIGDVEAEIADGLRGLLAEHDWRRVDLWLNAADERSSVGLVRPLCELLDVRDRYIQHEWIAETLGEIGIEEAINALTNACSFELSVDPSRSLAKRCLEALVAIGTDRATVAVQSQLASPWPELSEYAAELLAEQG